MKIPDNDPLHQLEISRPGTKEVRGKTEKESARSGASHEDKVDISGKAKQIQELNRLISSHPEIRSDRVEAIENKIASGKFRIQPEKIAENMIRAALQDEIS